MSRDRRDDWYDEPWWNEPLLCLVLLCLVVSFLFPGLLSFIGLAVLYEIASMLGL